MSVSVFWGFSLFYIIKKNQIQMISKLVTRNINGVTKLESYSISEKIR